MTTNLIFNNTYNSGRVRCFIFKEAGDKHFTGVALEFDIVVHGKTAEKTEECLLDTTENYLRNVVDNGLSQELLNQPADKKYWEVYKRALEAEEKFTNLVLDEGSKNISSAEIPFNIVRSDYKNGNFNFA